MALHITKRVRFVLAMVAILTWGYSISAVASPCGGRPTKADLDAVRALVGEQVVEERYWFGEGVAQISEGEAILGVNPKAQDGANILVMVPSVGYLGLWRVCDQRFAYVSGERYPGGIHDADLENVRTRYREFFENGGGSSSLARIAFPWTPDFGTMSLWKKQMLSRIQTAVACFASQTDKGAGKQKHVSMQIGDFGQRSLKVPVAVPERNELWIVTLKLNPEGIADQPVVGSFERLSGASPELKSRLKRDSFPLGGGCSRDTNAR